MRNAHPMTVDGTSSFENTARNRRNIQAQCSAADDARRVLIMIDGKRTVDDLSIVAKPGEIESAIASLESSG